MDTVFVIPAHDEKATLEKSVLALLAWARGRFHDGGFTIIISENASSDGTDLIGSRLANTVPEVVFLSSDMPGKGAALKWGMSVLDARLYVMMDADMSVDLDSVGRMLDAADEDTLVIASRRMPGSMVERGAFRRAVTATYAGILNALLGLGVRDAQCGCKILPVGIRDEALRGVRDDGFFFDTELLARTHAAGFRIREMPVAWTERGSGGRGSSVRIMRTSLGFMRRLYRLKREL
jgi:glycosyltransferase involved in cell wall biosynthesis